ncbi:MAG TPA: hypothetical protein VLB47_02790 [Solirubrobacteraceae bacterium]|nr:hypothetical protein [Solirubrobacteraceae bacterium]
MRPDQRPLSAGWVAGSVRSRHLLARRLGRDRARALASCASLADALAELSGTAYGRRVRPGMGLADAQRAVAATALWHVRVLAGWVPGRGLAMLRALAAWFELANVEDRLAAIAGARTPPPAFALGGLATAWSRVAGAQGAAEVRRALSGSAWGDPGSDDAAAMHVALRVTWARRVMAAVPEGAPWAAGAVALLAAREILLERRPPAALAMLRPPGLRAGWSDATTVPALLAALTPDAAWALDGAREPHDLWRAEARWWRRLERDGEQLTHDVHLGRAAIVGSVALLGVDAWRTAGALEFAARGRADAAMEVFEELA